MRTYTERLNRGLAGYVRVFTEGNNGRLLAAVAIGWFLALGVRLIFPAVLPEMRGELGMGLGTAGLLLALLWGSYAIMQFPGGMLADWFGERSVLTWSIAIAAVGTLGIVVGTSVSLLFAGTLVLGLGVGLYGTTRITVLSDTFPEHSGTAIGLNQAAGNVGTTMLPPLAGLIALWVGWRWSFGVLLPLFAVIVVGLWLSVPHRTSPQSSIVSGDSSANTAYILEILSGKEVICASVTMALLSFVYQSFTGFYPSFLVAEKGLGSGTAATFLGLFFAAAIVIQPLAGSARDRFGARNALVVILLLTTVILVALTRIQGIEMIVPLTLLASLQLAIWPITNSYLVDIIPSDVQGTAVGLARSFYLLIGALGPVFTGFLADNGYFNEAFLALAGIVLASLVPVLFLTKRTGRETAG